MAFKEAKQKIASQLDQKIKKTEKGGLQKAMLNSRYESIKDGIDGYIKKTKDYIDNINYKGKATDKSKYLNLIDATIAKILEDKEVAYTELMGYGAKIEINTDNYYERIVLQQKAHEELEFEDAKKKSVTMITNGKFNDAFHTLSRVKEDLTPLSTTNKEGNLAEKKIRLDLRIEEEIIAVQKMREIYKAKFKKGNLHLSNKGNLYIHGTDPQGNVIYSDYKFNAEMHKAGKKPNIGKKKKMNWLQFKAMTRVGKFRKAAEFKVHNLAADGISYSKKIDNPDVDKSILNSKAKIEEIKRLKEIHHIFSGQALDKIKDPAQKELMKKALDMQYNSMRLYFQKDKDGVVRPTEVYKTTPLELRVRILMKMIMGINQKAEEIKMTEALATAEKDKDVVRKLFYKGELAFKRKDYFEAYANFKQLRKIKKREPQLKKYVNKQGEKQYDQYFKTLKQEGLDINKVYQHAENRLRMASQHILNVAEKYVYAACSQPNGSGFYLSGDVTKQTMKDARKVIGGLRKLITSGAAIDIQDAISQSGHPWFSMRDRQKGVNWSKLGKTEAALRIYHMPMLYKIAKAAMVMNKETRDKLMLQHADDARKGKFRKAAGVLYKEIMNPAYNKHEKGLKKTDKYWEAKRKKFMDLRSGKGWLGSAFIRATKAGAREMAQKARSPKFNSLSAKQQKVEIAKYEEVLFKQQLEKDTKSSLYKGFLKNAEGSSKAAAKYVDMEDPFDEWFNLSDAGEDTLKEYVGEAVILACSGGIGNLVGRGATAGLRTLAKKSAEKLAVRLATSGAGIAVDLVVSEIIDRGMRTVLQGKKGLFSRKELTNFIKHGVSTYGVLSLGGKFTRWGGAKLAGLKALKGKQGLVNFAVGAGSAVAIEAPSMALLNAGFEGNWRNWSKNYGHSLMNILAARAGMKLLHGSMGNAMLRLEQKLEMRSQLAVLKAKNPAKGKLVEGLMKNRDFPQEGIQQIMDSNMNTQQIRDLSKYMNNPQNAGFLIALKYAEGKGEMSKAMTERYNKELASLRKMGFSKAQAKKFARNMTLEGLVKKHGAKSKETADLLLDKAIKEQRGMRRKEFVVKQKQKIGDAIRSGGKPLVAAWHTYVKEFKGHYADFKAKHPKLADKIPTIMRELAPLGLSVIAGLAGIPLLGMVAVKSPKLTELRLDVNAKYKDFKKLEVVERDESKSWKPATKVKITKADGTTEIIDAKTPLYGMTDRNGNTYSVTVERAGHIKDLHLDGAEAGSTFYGKTMEDVMIDIVQKMGTKDALEKQPGAFEIEMGKPTGKDGVASLKELVKDGSVRKDEVQKVQAVKEEVFKLNASGDEVAKQAFIDKFKSDNPDSTIQFILRSGMIIPEVNVPKRETTKLFVVFGDDGKGGKTMYTATPGRHMPRFPNPKQFRPKEGGVKGENYKDSQRAWIEGAFLRGISPEGQKLIDIVKKGDVSKLVLDGTLQKGMPEISKLLDAHGEEGRKKVAAILTDLRSSKEFKEIVAKNPDAKTVIELAALFHQIARQPTQKGKAHEKQTAAQTDAILKQMTIPKEIRDQVVSLVQYRKLMSNLAQENIDVGSGKVKEGKRKVMNAEKISDLILDKNTLHYLKVLNSVDVKNAKVQSELSTVYKEVGKLFDSIISQTKISAYSEKYGAKIGLHEQNLANLSYKERLSYVQKLFKQNPVEAASLADKLFSNVDTSVNVGTKREASLENIEAYRKDSKSLDRYLKAIDDIRGEKNKNLQYSLMQVLFDKNPALYTAAMEKLTYDLAPSQSAKHKDAKVEKIKKDFKSQEEIAALDKLAARVKGEIVDSMLDSHAIGYSGMIETILEGGRQSAHERKSQGLDTKSTKGDDFKLAGSMSVFTYQGAFWTAPGKDVLVTFNKDFANSKKSKDAFYVTEDYVVKPPKSASRTKEAVRKSFDEKLKDVMNKKDMQEYTAYKIAAYLMKQAKSTGVKTADIPSTDIRLNLVNYFRRNSDTEKLPDSKLGGRPEGHLRYEIPIDQMVIKVPKMKITELLAKQKKELAKYEKQGRDDKIKRTEALIKRIEAQVKSNPEMSVRDMYVNQIKDTIKTLEAKVKANPNDTYSKKILDRLKKFKFKNIKEYEKGSLSKENQYAAREYVESIFGLSLSNQVQLREYAKLAIVNTGNKANVHLPKESIAFFREYLVGKREGQKVPKDAITVEDGKLIIDRSKVSIQEFSVRGEVREFIKVLPEMIAAKKKVEKAAEKSVIPDELKPLGRILGKLIKPVAEVYPNLQRMKNNPAALQGIVNGKLKGKLGMSDEQVKAVLDTLK